MKINQDCLRSILIQNYPEVGEQIAEEFAKRGVTTLTQLENMPRRLSTPIIYGISIYEIVSFVVTALTAVGCPEKVHVPMVGRSTTYSNILSPSGATTGKPRKPKTKEIRND